MNNLLINKFSFLLLILVIPGLVSGPFIPDLFISILGTIFLINIFINKNFKFIYNNFLFFFILFYFIILLSSLLSENILFSLESSLFYFRFGIFALVVSFIINCNSKYIKYFFLVTLMTFTLVSIDALYEIILGHNIFLVSGGPGRIAGLFGEDFLVIGSFLSRNFPLLIFLFLYTNPTFKKVSSFYFLAIILLSVFVIFSSGERTAIIIITLILFIYSVFLFKFYLIKYYKILLPVIFSLIIFCSLPFIFSDNQKKRITSDIKNHLSLDVNRSIYYAYYNTSYLMFLDKPIFGHGTKMFRKKCSEYKLSEKGCNSHPHSTYFQLLAETGAIGFLSFFSIFIYVCTKIIKIILKKNINILDWQKLSLLVSFFITTFPFIPSGNFFNNWLSVIYFLPVGFYIYLEKK